MFLWVWCPAIWNISRGGQDPHAKVLQIEVMLSCELLQLIPHGEGLFDELIVFVWDLIPEDEWAYMVEDVGDGDGVDE